jgi:Spy/CpxP family protein refolding chaperone
MKNMKWKRLLILFSIALNIGFVAHGAGHFILQEQGRPDHDGFSAKGMENAYYHRLNLSDHQHDRVDTLLSRYAVRQRELKQANKQAHVDLSRLLAGYKECDRPALLETIERMANIKKERELLTAEHLLEVKAVLNEQQAGRLFARLQEVVEMQKE